MNDTLHQWQVSTKHIIKKKNGTMPIKEINSFLRVLFRSYSEVVCSINKKGENVRFLKNPFM